MWIEAELYERGRKVQMTPSFATERMYQQWEERGEKFLSFSSPLTISFLFFLLKIVQDMILGLNQKSGKK